MQTETPVLIDRILKPFQRFVKTESATGFVLLACTALALAWGQLALGRVI